MTSKPYWIKSYPCDENRLLVVGDAVVADVMTHWEETADGPVQAGWIYVHSTSDEFPVFDTREAAMQAALDLWVETQDETATADTVPPPDDISFAAEDARAEAAGLFDDTEPTMSAECDNREPEVQP